MDTTTTLAQQETMVSVLQTAPMILLKNQNSKDKAKVFYDQLMKLVEDQGMNQVYDEQLKKFIEKIKLTIKSANDERAPITQTLDRIKKEFTTIESELKLMADTSQQKRNEYIAAEMAKKKAKEEENRKRLEKDKEVIDLKRLITIAYKNRFSDITTDVKKMHLEWFNSIKLETGVTPDALQYSSSIHIGNLKTISTTDLVNLSRINLTGFIDNGCLYTHKYHNIDDIRAMAKEIFNTILPPFELDLAKEVELQKQDMLDKLPSKISELEELALADVAETERLLEEKRKRELKEQEDLRLAAEEKLSKDTAAATVQAAGDTAAATVDATLFEEAPKVAESYSIKIANRAAWGMIFQFWFEKEGKSLTDEKLEKYTMLRMKAFCEKWAKDNDEFIKTPGISYEAVYKAK